MILCANPSAQFKSYQTEIEEAVLAVMRGNRYVLGEEVALFEREFADYIDDENKFTNNKPEINKVINGCFVCHK